LEILNKRLSKLIKGGYVGMKKRTINIVIFILSLICLLISIRLFWNMGIFADEYNTSPSIMCGSDFWLNMDWLRLALLSAVCILSVINISSTHKK